MVDYSLQTDSKSIGGGINELTEYRYKEIELSISIAEISTPTVLYGQQGLYNQLKQLVTDGYIPIFITHAPEQNEVIKRWTTIIDNTNDVYTFGVHNYRYYSTMEEDLEVDYTFIILTLWSNGRMNVVPFTIKQNAQN